jgi:hypothetical protein
VLMASALAANLPTRSVALGDAAFSNACVAQGAPQKSSLSLT